MLGRHLSRWPSIIPILNSRIVFVGWPLHKGSRGVTRQGTCSPELECGLVLPSLSSMDDRTVTDKRLVAMPTHSMNINHAQKSMKQRKHDVDLISLTKYIAIFQTQHYKLLEFRSNFHSRSDSVVHRKHSDTNCQYLDGTLQSSNKIIIYLFIHLFIYTRWLFCYLKKQTVNNVLKTVKCVTNST